MIGVEKKSFFVGAEAEKLIGLLDIIYPVKAGIWKDWDAMEKLLDHIYMNELRIDPKECNIVVVDAPGNSKEEREKITEMMFKTFEFQNVCIIS